MNQNSRKLSLIEIDESLCDLLQEMRRTATSGVGLKVYADTVEAAIAALRQAALAKQAQPLTEEIKNGVAFTAWMNAEFGIHRSRFSAGDMSDAYERGARDRMAQQAQPVFVASKGVRAEDLTNAPGKIEVIPQPEMPTRWQAFCRCDDLIANRFPDDHTDACVKRQSLDAI